MDAMSLQGELGDYRHGLRGHIHMLCNTAARSEHLPELLAAFLARHAGITIDLDERTSQDIVDAVRGGLCDLALVADSADIAGLHTFAFRASRCACTTSTPARRTPACCCSTCCTAPADRRHVPDIPETRKGTAGDGAIARPEFSASTDGLADEGHAARNAGATGTGTVQPIRGSIMTIRRQSLAVFLASAFATLAAHAQAPLTRADVIAQYQEAARTGDLIAPGDSGLKLSELYPNRYPKAQPAPGLTRAQVVEELRAATRSGDVLAAGDSGIKLNGMYPQRYPTPAEPAAAGKTRGQVREETLEAIRTGDILAAGDSGLRRNELAPQLYANARAGDAAAHRAMVAASMPDAGPRAYR